MDEGQLLHDLAMAEAAAGEPGAAAERRLALVRGIRDQAAENLLRAAQFQTVGRYAEPVGTNFMATSHALSRNLNFGQRMGEQYVMAGLNRLEEGQPQAAAELFREAIRETDPLSPFARLAGRYYFLITGEFLDADLPTP